ncbi:MAG: hypothetical protein IJ730_04995 [Alphaproteobacteria bacterium]|nr:hypothetical protein [Alphaproteobacteria bacterium]
MKKILIFTATFCISAVNHLNGMENLSSSVNNNSMTKEEVLEYIDLYKKKDLVKQYEMKSEKNTLSSEELELIEKWNTDYNFRISALIGKIESFFGKLIKDKDTAPLLQLLQSFFFKEMFDSSRACKNENESAATANLILTIKKQTGIEINEVRFLDALSITNHLIDDSKNNIKEEAINQLNNNNLNNNIKFIMRHMNSYRYTSYLFKRYVFDIIRNYGPKSKIFRDCLIANIAEIESKFRRPIPDMTVTGNGFTFIETFFPYYSGFLHKIGLNCIRDHVYMLSFFDCSYTVKNIQNGVFASKFDNIQVFHHEIGHSSSALLLDRQSYFDKTDLTMEFISKSFKNTLSDFSSIDQTITKLKQIPDEKIKAAFVSKFIKKYRSICDNSDMITIDSLKNSLIKVGESEEGRAKLAFLTSDEILQIIGLALVKNENRNVLFINSLSDFALSVELGLPIRCDHSALGLNPLNMGYKYLIPESPWVLPSFNFDFYGAMFEVYGSTMQQYIIKIMYGNNFLAALKAEVNLEKRKGRNKNQKMVVQKDII